MSIDFNDPITWDQPITDGAAISLGIWAINTLKYPDASDDSQFSALDFFADGATEALAQLRERVDATMTESVMTLIRDIEETVNVEDWDSSAEGDERVDSLLQQSLVHLRSLLGVTCERHGGPWGSDPTCPRCTTEGGSTRPVSEPGPLTDEEE